MTESTISNAIIICMLRIAKNEIYENKNIAAYLTLTRLLEQMGESG